MEKDVIAAVIHTITHQQPDRAQGTGQCRGRGF